MVGVKKGLEVRGLGGSGIFGKGSEELVVLLGGG